MEWLDILIGSVGAELSSLSQDIFSSSVADVASGRDRGGEENLVLSFSWVGS